MLTQLILKDEIIKKKINFKKITKKKSKANL
jgi:hypothetical protein